MKDSRQRIPEATGESPGSRFGNGNDKFMRSSKSVVTARNVSWPHRIGPWTGLVGKLLRARFPLHNPKPSCQIVINAWGWSKEEVCSQTRRGFFSHARLTAKVSRYPPMPRRELRQDAK